MWARNALFLFLCLAGAGALSAGVLRVARTESPIQAVADRYERADYRQVIGAIDAQFESDWKAAGVTPTPCADDLTIARRLSLGLMGTLPSVEEIRWLEAQPEASRLEAWISHVLEDRRFSDYAAERLARSYVGVDNGPFLIFRRHRFTTWLSDQLHANVPYDKLARTLITGEGLATTNPEVNFLTATIDPNGGKRPDEVKLAARVSRAFLGMRMDCVQCHNDRLGGDWKQSDFHQLAAYFAGAENSLTGIHDSPQRKYEFKYLKADSEQVVDPAVPFASELDPGGTARRKRLAAWVTNPSNKAFSRAIVNHIWAMMYGRPLVEPVDDIPLKGPYPAGLELLADDFTAHGYDLRRLIRVIAGTRVYQLDSRGDASQPAVTAVQEKHHAAFPLTRLRAEQVAGSLLQAASLKTIDGQAHVLVRVIRAIQETQFLQRYGDGGEDEFGESAGTIPQRLLMMNGQLVKERTQENLAFNSSTQIALLGSTDEKAVEAAYLAVLTRRPTETERTHFVERLANQRDKPRIRQMEDICWALINSTEFSWNH